MTNALQLLTTKNLDGIYLDCYVERGQEHSGDFWATREQIGMLLGYVKPRDAIAHIHMRNKERLDKFSGVVNLSTPSGTQATTVYNFKGLLEICRYSNQPIANDVIDKLWEIADEIRRTGSYNAYELEPLNVRARVAEVLQRLALQVSDKQDKQEIISEAFKIATGHELPKKEEPAPTAKTHRYWTAQQIGNTLKWAADAVLHRAENLGITKKEQNGYWDGDTWYFSKEGRKKFLELVHREIVKIEDGFEYYEDGRKHIHWSFDI